MPVIPSKVSFNAGELGPLVDSRLDLEKYLFGCRTLENWWPRIEGPVYFRPGTHHAGFAKYAHSKCRLEHFIYSETTRFVMEFGLNYARFWSNYLSVDMGGTISAWSQGTVLVSNGAIDVGVSDTTLTSASNPFTAAMVGDAIIIVGAGAGGIDHRTTIASFTGAGEVEISTAASTTVTGADVINTNLYTVGDYVSNGGSNWYCVNTHYNWSTFAEDEDETITGTITAAGTAVTGTTTDFVTDLAVGDWLRTATGGSADYVARIASIESTTALTLENPFQGVNPNLLEGLKNDILTSTSFRRVKWIEQDTLEVYTPYSVADAFNLAFEQINDIIYITHPNHPLAKLTRSSDDYWTYEAVDWTFPPLRPQNLTSTTIDPSADEGTITLTASTAIFEAGHVGSYWGIKHRVKGLSIAMDLVGDDPATPSTNPPTEYIEMRGDWSIVTVERYAGKLEIVRCSIEDNPATGSNWEIIREWHSEANSTIAVTGFQEERAFIGMRFDENAQNDVYHSDYWRTGGAAAVPTAVTEPKPYAYLTCDEAYLGGFVEITAFSSSTSVTALVKKNLYDDSSGKTGDPSATKFWSEGAFSDVRGHPRAVKLYDGRLALCGHSDEPKGVYMSEADDFEDFEFGTNDSDPLKFIIAGRRNVIQWAEEAGGRLFIGTLGEEITLSGGGFDEPVTPTSVKAKTGTSYGSARLPGLNLNDVIIFVQQGGKFVRELVYNWDTADNGGYQSNDLTRLSRHITGDGITDIGISRTPYPIYWATRADGQLLGMLLERADGVVSWFRTTTSNSTSSTTTQGKFNSVCTIPDANGNDEPWVSVLRVIDSDISIQTVEYFDDGEFTTLQSSWRLDQGRTFNQGIFTGGLTITRGKETLSDALGALPTWTPDLSDWVGWSWLVTVPDGTVHGIQTGIRVRMTGATVATLFPELAGRPFRVFVIDTKSFYLIHIESGTDLSVDGITVASPAEITLDPVTNDFGRTVFIDGVGGMTEVNLRKFNLQPLTAVPNSSALLNNVDSSAYTPFTTAGTAYMTPPITPETETSLAAYSADMGFEVVVDRIDVASPGADWLQGENITAMVDGSAYEGLTTTGATIRIDLPEGIWGNQIYYGIKYTGTVETQKIDIPMDVGSSRGRITNMTRIGLGLLGAWGLKVGLGLDQMEEVHLNEWNLITDTDLTAQEGEHHILISKTMRSPSVFVLQDKPYPATLTALYPQMDSSQAT